MIRIDRSKTRLTSVTIRATCRTALNDARKQLLHRDIIFSEQRLMRECLRLALKFWRGNKEIAARNKKYNQRVGPYQIVPFCTTEALRSVSWARCHHAGISLSRLMDFAIANYLPRVVEYWLRFDYASREKSDLEIWMAKYAVRRHPENFVISYTANTEKNDGIILFYAERTQILPWPPPAFRDV